MPDYFIRINRYKRWVVTEVTYPKGVVFEYKNLKSFESLSKAREYLRKIKGDKK